MRTACLVQIGCDPVTRWTLHPGDVTIAAVFKRVLSGPYNFGVIMHCQLPSHLQVVMMAGICSLAILAHSAGLKAGEQPVSIVAARISGHIHPSLCRTKDGTLVVVYKGANVLMRSRSTDGGKTWEKPVAIATSAMRPKLIRKVKKFEIYPGTADTLPDGRVLVTWNYIADDKANDGYYQRALLYTLSLDQGRTWSEQKLIGPVDGKHLGAVRHNVLPWSKGRWLLPLRDGPPRLFDPKTGKLTVFALTGPDRKQHEFQQIVRTARGTLLAMGSLLLRSTDRGRRWTAVKNFPAVPIPRDNAEGRYLTVLKDGRVLVTWGVGHKNQGLRYNVSADDGRTWNKERTVTLLPKTSVTARYYSARTIQLDDRHIGTVFMNRRGIHFLKVRLDRVTK
ncbi:MAG: exo-alpha-sialidase [Planctomycetes bacterium]|nr:exo-alpha-sialidase [Planctomycetota bacterium]